MNAMAKWVETHVGRDIRYHPTVAFPDAIKWRVLFFWRGMALRNPKLRGKSLLLKI